MSYSGSVIYLKSVPQGAPTEADFEIRARDITKDSVEEGAIVVKILYLSVDPYLVGKLRGMSSYTEAFKVGEPLSSGAYGQVVESKSADFKVGDNVVGMFEWAEYTKVVPKGAIRKAIEGVDPEALLSVCGITGITAYFGLLDIGNPKEGETVLVSGAAGATGSIVGQIAKLKGCYVVGIAGADDKCDLLVKEFGFDKAINYKKVGNIKDAIAEACPKGVDIYFDNVGGETLDAALRCMNNFGRVPLCGAISQYTATTQQQGPRNETIILQKRLKVQGFLVPDYIPQFPTAYKELIPWYLSGKLKKRVTVYNSIQQTVPAFLDLLQGANTGKMLVKF